MLSSFRIQIGNISPSAIQWHFILWKWRTKTLKTYPSPCTTWTPHVLQQCLGSPHAPPQTAAPTVEALSHTDAVKSPLVTMTRPNSPPKVPLPMDRLANPNTCLIRGPARTMMPNDIRIWFLFFHNALDRPTDRPTDRSRESLMTIGGYALRATQPNNTTITNVL